MEPYTAKKTRKRSSRESNSEDNSGDDSKKRGRPRVEKSDESAADRRRTQIRMAQRAYRQRKESTLEELRKRVSELTNTIELMNKAFVDCRNRLSQSALASGQSLAMRETAEQFEALMKCARNPRDECDPEAARLLHRASTGSDQAQDRTAAEPRNVPSWMDEHVLHTGPRQRSSAELGMGYTMYMQPAEELPSNVQPTMDFFGNFEQQPKTLAHATRASSANSLSPYHSTSGPVTMPPEIPVPTTYSFQEGTFGRRLHRSCLEQGVQLLLNPARRPATYDRVFRLALMSVNKETLLNEMKSRLAQGTDGSLDHDESPLIHIGGAGTHFPRRDRFGNIQPKKDSWNLGVVGPQTVALLENAARDNLTTDMTVSVSGFEGEWFDPYDVEGYLQELGIFIDPASSFAEAEVLITPSVPSNASVNTLSTDASSPKTPEMFSSKQEAIRMFDNEQLEFLSLNDASLSDWNHAGVINMTGVGYSDASTGSWMNFLQPGEALRMHGAATNSSPSSATWDGSKNNTVTSFQENSRLGWQHKASGAFAHTTRHKKRVLIDVAKFLKVIMATSTCVGRAPGFRRKDVDRALVLSIFDAYGDGGVDDRDCTANGYTARAVAV